MKRPVVAIVANVQTPYRVAMHRRLIREIPEVEFYSVYTHDVADQNWAADLAADINPVRFGLGDSPSSQLSWLAQPHEWAKGGQVMQWVREKNVAAIAMGGYNDLGRIHVLIRGAGGGIPLFLFSDSNIQREKRTGFKHLLKRVLLSRILRFFDVVFVPGTNGHKYYQYFGVSDSRIVSFPLEVDYDTISSVTGHDIDQAARTFGLASGRKRYVYCGRMEIVKRPDLAVRAFLDVADQIPDWDLVMIGDGALAKGLQDSIPEHLRQRVRWLGFLNDQKQIAAVYRNCHALVLSSDREQWGLVLNEATASGIAVIAADRVGAVPELVQENRNGFTFTTGSKESLSQVLVAMAQPGVSDRMGEASLQVIQEWRAAADPVRGMRMALERHGIIPKAPNSI
jgi:glycosyltransferase involved in cell wall biosynthesis